VNENGSGQRTYLLFLWSPTGYSVREQEGDPPMVGSELEENGQRLVITKIGSSPFPGDRRHCAYSMGKPQRAS
jgi:hypothetical protein